MCVRRTPANSRAPAGSVPTHRPASACESAPSPSRVLRRPRRDACWRSRRAKRDHLRRPRRRRRRRRSERRAPSSRAVAQRELALRRVVSVAPSASTPRPRRIDGVLMRAPRPRAGRRGAPRARRRASSASRSTRRSRRSSARRRRDDREPSAAAEADADAASVAALIVACASDSSKLAPPPASRRRAATSTAGAHAPRVRRVTRRRTPQFAPPLAPGVVRLLASASRRRAHARTRSGHAPRLDAATAAAASRAARLRLGQLAADGTAPRRTGQAPRSAATRLRAAGWRQLPSTTSTEAAKQQGRAPSPACAVRLSERARAARRRRAPSSASARARCEVGLAERRRERHVARRRLARHAALALRRSREPDADADREERTEPQARLQAVDVGKGIAPRIAPASATSEPRASSARVDLRNSARRAAASRAGRRGSELCRDAMMSSGSFARRAGR